MLLTMTIIAVYLSPLANADDAGDVRATIERHYAAINSGQLESVFNDHLDDMTMFLADGTVLWEGDWEEVSARMGATAVFGELNVRMSDFNVQLYGDVAVATFYLVGTETRADTVRDITNRVTAVWIKSGGDWKEAHHHESPLLGRGPRH
ncbi:MAG: DUF4440 domain-containing protein [Xanthomonadales bacterium]|nr:nuclear transport factor 2 family protein [Xanthomonadales bacterium]NIX13487.1 DUF4440 domain-containing protein [Xanthomonadales bacterium]